MQTFTGAAHFSYKFVNDDAGQACQHGNTEQMKKHRWTLSGDFSFQECDTFNVAERTAGASKNMLCSHI